MGTARRARAASRPVWATAAAVAAALLLAACASTLAPAGTGGSGATGPGSGARSGAVITLNNISTLRALFNREAGHPRLILIFSPT